MKVYGHPWSINTRKVLVTLAEKQHDAELVLLMIPKGEHKQPAHLERHPFGKVPSIADDGFELYETSAINRYLDRKLPGTALVPADDRDRARMDQWIAIADAYFIPHAGPLVVETLFRPYLGGERDDALIERMRAAIQPALDVLERQLDDNAHVAGKDFSLADIHWMPYFEYLAHTDQSCHTSARRPNLASWWDRVSSRRTWQRVARTGPQPYEPGVRAEMIEQLRRG